jgi:outer membrane protein OmpA-like peptidoglycan-associated protein
MRILITGLIAFVIWCVFSAWIYNDHMLPALRKPAPVVTVPDAAAREADSLMKLKAMMPKELTIYFEFNDAKLKAEPQYENSIAEFKAWLDKYPGHKLSVVGHTDLVGTPEYNADLGLKRAQVVGKYIEGLGISPEKIITGTAGEAEPAAGYITQEQRAKNRRTEITIKLN